MRSIGLVSEKGGTGKSTTCLNLAAGLAARGQRVLVIDTDPQANASHVLMAGQRATRPALADVLLANAEPHEALVSSPSFKGVDLLPADPSLADAAVALANEVGRERRLRLALEQVGQDYDWALVDSSPTRSVLTVNVMNAVQELLVPMAPGLFGVLGLAQLQADVEQVRKFLDNRTLRIGGILLSMTERNNVSKGVEDQLRQVFKGLVFETRIPRNLKLEEAHSRHQSIFDYAPSSPGAVAFEQLVEEVLGHVKEARRRNPAPSRNPDADRAA